jgi:roadblock/LC7 domain-containing protein
MINLESLLKVQGVIAALRFSDDGSLIESVGELERTHSRLAADICYANGRVMHQGGDMLMTLSDMKGWPPHGWMMMSDELSICAVAAVACFVRNSEASFNEVLRVLSEVGHQ